MFTDLQYDAKIAEVTYAMSHGGVFLTTSHQGRDNTMTIGWGASDTTGESPSLPWW